MTLTVWRIVKAKYAGGAFSGEGARRFGGRWNNRGTPVVYTAGSRALAILEMLVHLEAADLLRHYRLIPVEFDNSLVRILDEGSLPGNWNRRPAPASIRSIGDACIAMNQSPVLRVPSVIVPGEHNYLLNPQHPQFVKLAIGKPEVFRFDRRLK